MSFICPSDNCESDMAVDILKQVFGSNFIESFFKEGTPHPVLVAKDPTNIMAAIADNISLAALMIVAIIISFGIIKGLINASNDGEATGITKSLLGTYGRPLFSVVMLSPTASGYALIHVIIIALVLWSNSIANIAFGSYVKAEMGLSNISVLTDNPNYQTANDLIVPTVYGALHGYCAKYADAKVGSQVYTRTSSAWTSSSGVKTPVKLPGLTYVGQKTTLDYPEDSVGAMLGITGSVCGSFETTFNVQELINKTAANEIDQSDITLQNDLITLRKKVTNTRVAYILAAYYDGYYIATHEYPLNDSGNVYANGGGNFVASYSQAPWSLQLAEDSNIPQASKPLVRPLIEVAIERKRRLDAALQTMFQNEGLIVANTGGTLPANANNAISRLGNLNDRLIKQGWLAAGTYRSRFRKYTIGLSDAISEKPYSYALANLKPDDDAEEHKAFITNLNTLRTSLFEQIKESGLAPSYSMINTESLAYTYNSDKIKPDSVFDGPNNAIINSVFNMEENIINTLLGTGPGDGVDALQRIQMTGDYIFGLELFIKKVHFVASAAIAAIAILGSPTITKLVADSGQIYDGVHNLFQENFGAFVIEMADSLDLIARYFSTIIPTMPYIFLGMAAVGWLIQIIQTMLGMPLFFIMHSIPQRSFLGDQAQGYVTLISLIFRPLLIVSGFFLSFLLYDPMVTYVTKVYITTHENMAGATFDNSILKLYTVLRTFKWYWLIYANILLAVTYLCFGLIQELGDSLMDWLGTRVFGGGFGNLNTSGIMKNASSHIDNSVEKSKATRNSVKQSREAREAKEEQEAKDKQQQKTLTQIANNTSRGGYNSVPRARNAGMSDAMGTGTGTTARSEEPSLKYDGSRNVGATAAITAGSAAIGAVQGAGQLGRSWSEKASQKATETLGSGLVGRSAGAIAGVGGALAGGVAGAARGGFGGATRGLKAWGGRNSYQDNLAKARQNGALGTTPKPATSNTQNYTPTGSSPTAFNPNNNPSPIMGSGSGTNNRYNQSPRPNTDVEGNNQASND